MAWSVTLSLVALSAAIAVIAFCTTSVPYLFVGSFSYTVLSLDLEVNQAIAFAALFAFRYWRLFVNIIAYTLYRPAQQVVPPKYNPSDVTVICPTIEPWGDTFRQCVETVCLQGPAAFFIVVGRPALVSPAEDVCVGLRLRYPNVRIEVHASPVPGKRIQIDHVISRVATAITVCIDDHVFWPTHGRFLRSILAAFEDDNIRLVGTNKRVIIEPNQSLWKTYWNMIGALYLERHNFEIMASTWIDGGLFAVSGRTCAIRSDILHDPEYRQRYLNETIGFLSLTWGPLGADDDNFTTRFVFEKGFGVRIQAEEDSLIATTLGWFPKHLHTSLRWSRTTFRSNPRSLLMPRTWTAQPWSIYAVYISGMINFAAVWDPLLCVVYRQTPWSHGWLDVHVMICFILLTKLVKTWPFFRRHPRHLFLFPGYVLFAYYHSFIKLWSLLTFWNVEWSGRSAAEIVGGDAEAQPLLPSAAAAAAAAAGST